jgi:diguanylate cyclase (GGDEF)-like protein/PAS domain S-box-containing protein
MWQFSKRFLQRPGFTGRHRSIGLTVLILLCIWGSAGAWSWWARDSALTSNRLILEQLAAAVQSQTKGLFKQAELSLTVAGRWIEDNPHSDPAKSADFLALCDALRRESDGLLDLRVVTRSGLARSITGTPKIDTVDVSDRDYFRAQLDTQTRGLFIGKPMVGRMTNKNLIPISFPLTTSAGEVAVLLVAMDLDRMAGPFEAERIKPAGTIGIVRNDGMVLLRSPMAGNLAGRSIASGQAWKQYISQSAKGSYESNVSLFDQQPRLVSFAKVEGLPLVVYVSASKIDALAPWRVHTAILAGVATLLSIVTVVVSRALTRAFAAARISDAIVKSADEAIVGKSLDGVVNSWNPGAEQMFGYSAAEMLGQPVRKLLPPDRQGEEERILESIRSGRNVEHFETKRLRKDGSVIDVSVTISPIRDSMGSIIGASKIARDISAQLAATRRLRLTASVFTNASEGILITDREGRMVEVNEAFTRITGYSRDDVVGNTPQMFRSSRQGPQVFKSMHVALIRHGEWKGEMWSRTKSGEAYSVWLTVSQVKGRRGKVRNYVALFSDVTALKLQQEKLEHSAQFDPLTDLPNRSLLSDRLNQAMTMCQRHNRSLAVLYMDLDGFKAINDRHGHKAGDELLVAVATQVKAVLRDVDTLARLGGDEFVAVLTDVDNVQDCIHMANRILAAFAKPVLVEDTLMHVTVSIGVTMYPQDSADADHLMRHADQAMYEAKQSGKNRFHLFDSAQDAEVKSRTVQQDMIAQGLAQDEFVLHYQPKVDMHTGAVLGAEALIRWQHPERGLLLPGVFLPAIERHALNEAVGAWVLDQALKQMDAWKAQGLALQVSVNVPARQLQHPKFVKHLAELLSRYPGVSPEALELEVLETSALDDIATTATIMEECHRLGVRFAIDDFGTGYSSLTYLRHLPVETLKIDQSFVRDMLVDRDDLAIVKGVIGLAAAFQRDCIAEGVETVAHGTRLIALGCTHAQGFGIARPMPAEQVAAWCASWEPPPEWRTGAA